MSPKSNHHPPSQYREMWTQLKTNLNTLPSTSAKFLVDLFPIFQWLPRYNPKWLSSDLIAGLTCGIVVIPIV
jgi:sodium-independent sulfate anion transporter 11